MNLLGIAIICLVSGVITCSIGKNVKEYCRSASRVKAMRQLSISLNEVIDSLRNLPYEVEYILNEKGEIIFSETQYNARAVNFSNEQIAYLQSHPGSISVHNHNENIPPSLDDLAFAALCNNSYFVVVSPNYIYTVGPSASGWKSGEEVNVVVNRHLHLCKTTVVGRKLVKVETDGAQIYAEDFEIATTEEAIKAITEDLGYFYERRSLNNKEQNPSA